MIRLSAELVVMETPLGLITSVVDLSDAEQSQEKYKGYRVKIWCNGESNNKTVVISYGQSLFPYCCIVNVGTNHNLLKV